MCEISIIIPVYNTEAYLAECLDSVCCSTIFAKCEVILVNDGSTDGSGSIIREYQEKYDNIVGYTFANSGPGASRNRGMERASGTYLFFLDSDDRMQKDYLEKLYRYLEENECEVAYAGFSFWEKEGEQETLFPVVRSVLLKNRLCSGCDYLERRMDQGDWNNQVWCALYRRSFLERYHLRFAEEIRLYEDVLFSTQVLLCSSSVGMLPEYGYQYRTRLGSLVHSGMSREDVESSMYVAEKLRKAYEGYQRSQKHAAGRVLFPLVSMILYDIGKLYDGKMLEQSERKRYYRRLSRMHLWIPLLASVSGGKEAAKWLIFRFHWAFYYPLVKKMKNRNNCRQDRIE